MSQEDRKERSRGRISISPSGKFAILLIAALVIITVVLFVMRGAGLALIRGELYLFLPVAAVLSALIWGGYALVRRIRQKVVRTALGIALTIVLLLVLMIGISYASFLVNVTVPQKYATIKSPNGTHRLVVLRLIDADDGRVQQRKAARLEKDPEGNPEITVDDWGYTYRAYQDVLGVFYKPNTPREGEVYIGFASEGQLMVDWEDEETVARFFVKDPEPGDGGEMVVRSDYQ